MALWRIALIGLVQNPLAWAAPWILTSYYEAVTVTEDYGGYLESPTVVVQVVAVTPTANPVPEPISTSIETLGSYDDVTVVELLMPQSAGAELSYSYQSYNDYVYTKYYVNVVYSAATTCSSQWTTTSAVPISVPYAVADAIKPTAVSTSYSTYNYQPFNPSTTTLAIAYIDPTQLPSATLSSLSSAYSPYNYGDCSPPPSTTGSDYTPGSYYNSGSSDYDDNWLDDDLSPGLNLVGVILICVLGNVGLFLILGLIESWWSFRRMMRGWQARRGLPLCFTCMCIPLSCIFLTCSRRGYRARTAQEAEVLQQRWDEMSIWRKLGLWMKWGLRFRYPSFLGPAPSRIGSPGDKPVVKAIEVTQAQPSSEMSGALPQATVPPTTVPATDMARATPANDNHLPVIQEGQQPIDLSPTHVPGPQIPEQGSSSNPEPASSPHTETAPRSS